MDNHGHRHLVGCWWVNLYVGDAETSVDPTSIFRADGNDLSHRLADDERALEDPVLRRDDAPWIDLPDVGS